MEKVADYDEAEVERLHSISIFRYFRHILALKKRSDERMKEADTPEKWQ
jgi:hypothetical protein